MAALLMAGRHPYTDGNPLLATMPRRLTYRDIGGCPDSLEEGSDASITGDEHTPPCVPWTMANVHPAYLTFGMTIRSGSLVVLTTLSLPV